VRQASAGHVAAGWLRVIDRRQEPPSRLACVDFIVEQKFASEPCIDCLPQTLTASDRFVCEVVQAEVAAEQTQIWLVHKGHATTLLRMLKLNNADHGVQRRGFSEHAVSRQESLNASRSRDTPMNQGHH
jgi:hypothetical protein